jgi:FMN reductase
VLTASQLVLLGGSLRACSVSAQVLRACAELAVRHGARTSVLTASQLVLPPYLPDSAERSPAALRLLSALRRADGVIIATPTYHGGMSGLLKNALDHVEDLAVDTPAYLDGRVVGTVAVGWSEHGAATAVAELRNTVLSLRGWVTPMGVTVNAAQRSIVDEGVWSDAKVLRRLEILVGQVVEFAGRTSGAPLVATA